VGMIISGICYCVSACACPRSKRKTTWAINTKLGRHAVHGSLSASTDPDSLRSKVKGQGDTVIKCAGDVGMQVDMTA